MRSLILAVLFFAAFPVATQTTRPRLTTQRPPQAPEQSIFRVDGDSLPANYHGYDPILVWRQLSQRQLVKGEYETTAAFETRLSRLKAIPLFAGVLMDDVLPFEVDGEALEMEYHADSGLLSVALKPDFVWEGERLSGSFQRAFPLKRILNRSSSYVGTNAFGVRRRITRQTSTEIDLAFDNHEAGYSSGYDIDVPMNVASARQAKTTLRALAIYKLASPYLTTGTFKDEPTITEPTDFSTLHLNLNGQLLAIWLYELPTGRVLTKLDLEHSNESPAETHLAADDANEVDYTRVFTVNEVTRRAVIISKPEPIYPITASHPKFTGEVILRLVLGADSHVSNIVPVAKQTDVLTERAIEADVAAAIAAAIAAAKKLQFEPAVKNGHRVSQYVSVVYNFNVY